MEKHDIFAIAQELASALDKRSGTDQRPASKQFERRRISLTGAGEVTMAEIQAALRSLGACLPKRAAVWLDGKLRGIDGIEPLADTLWQLSLASVPVERRKPIFHAACHQPYRDLIGILYEAFIWYLKAPRTGGQVNDLGPVYRRLIYSYYCQLADRFAVEPSGKTPVDEQINQVFDNFFGVSAGQQVVADPAMELLVQGLQLSNAEREGSVRDDAAVRNLVRVAMKDYQKEVDDLRDQLAKLNADLQSVLKRIRGRFYVNSDPVVIQDKWQAVKNSPEHEVELGWLLNQVPAEAHEKVLQEVALAVSQEQKMPTMERFRDILSDVLKQQKRLIC